LKPHNVFLTNEGILKVGDFGLSATLAQGKRTTHVGTPCYLAPEVMNHEAYGESVDIWGIGVIGYEMMTLDFLWEKKGIMAAAVHAKPLKAEDLPDRFSALLRDCVAKSLAFEPKSRYTATELLSRVRRSSSSGGDDAIAKAMEGFGWSPLPSPLPANASKPCILA
jgi:NIMA (never in mitosis gene a)-related kinase